MSAKSLPVATLGFPRIGPRRELKFAVENYWSGKTSAAALHAEAKRIREMNWSNQRRLGVSHIPSNDFSLYDHVLDTSVMVGVVPRIYGRSGGEIPLETYFAMARGTKDREAKAGLPALEMTKWFDTNYHYMVPEFSVGQNFVLGSTKPIDEFLEAKALGIHTRPVLLGPITYLLLGKSKQADFHPLSLLPSLLPVYGQVLRGLAQTGADWVQIDEPALALDLDDETRSAYDDVYRFLSSSADLKILLCPYFGTLGDNLDTALRLPVAGLHCDLIRAPDEIEEIVERAPGNLILSLGIVDGRNVWRTDLDRAVRRVESVLRRRGEGKIILAPSCSLLHVPIDVALEDELDPELKSWLSFAVQKIEELVTIGRAVEGERQPVETRLTESAKAAAARAASSRVHDPAMRGRLAAITPEMTRRHSAHAMRKTAQQERFALPLYPTTTIGSFPQTANIRNARASYQKGAISEAQYDSFLKKETEAAIRWQEEIGIDVLVHGEYERNDMVQYFGEQLAGYAFTKHGWVQSYGSRCVRPPVIFGDVSRPHPMTIAWARYAQSLTDRPMKGMLTGPVTMLQWSFVRDDLPRETVCEQIALAIRDEVQDLEAAGIKIIQIDEPAIREGLPLRKRDWDSYLAWAVRCFRIASSGVADDTQIHTHMCYSEFNDIIAAIGAMDADVISIETARSKMELLDAFTTYRYPNEIGPGVYDIHAPRVPTVDEIKQLLAVAKKRLAADQIWVNPDCGLKTRSWEDVKPALENMVAAARQCRLSDA